MTVPFSCEVSSHNRPSRLLAALTGRSGEWFLTIILTGLFGKLLLMTTGLLILVSFGQGATEGFSGKINDLSQEEFAAAVLIAPLTESLLVLFIIWGLGFKFRWSFAPTVTLATLAVVPLHGLAIGSLMVTPMFFLFAVVQYNWSARGQHWNGFWVVVGAHATANLASIVLLSLLA